MRPGLETWSPVDPKPGQSGTRRWLSRMGTSASGEVEGSSSCTEGSRPAGLHEDARKRRLPRKEVEWSKGLSSEPAQFHFLVFPNCCVIPGTNLLRVLPKQNWGVCCGHCAPKNLGNQVCCPHQGQGQGRPPWAPAGPPSPEESSQVHTAVLGGGKGRGGSFLLCGLMEPCERFSALTAT